MGHLRCARQYLRYRRHCDESSRQQSLPSEGALSIRGDCEEKTRPDQGRGWGPGQPFLRAHAEVWGGTGRAAHRTRFCRYLLSPLQPQWVHPFPLPAPPLPVAAFPLFPEEQLFPYLCSPSPPAGDPQTIQTHCVPQPPRPPSCGSGPQSSSQTWDLEVTHSSALSLQPVVK